MARTHFEVGPAHAAFGGLHAGVLYSLMEATCLLALLGWLEDSERAVTHDLHASVVRRTPLGVRCQLTAKVIRRGRSLAFIDANAEVDGEIVATMRVTKSIIRG